MERAKAAAPPATDPATRRLRRHARIALYVALAATLGGTFLLAKLVRRPDPKVIDDVERLQARFDGIDFTTYPEVRLLQRYVAIDSAEPDPDELAAAELLARELAEAGLKPTVEKFAGRRANVWAFVEGEDPRAVVLAGHLDVEPARNQEGWRFPPFEATIDGPWIYGRGMYDMKSLGVAQLLATTDLARRGRKPARSILFLQTSAEETGSDTGTRWIMRHHPELVSRMGLVLTEGGVVEALSYDQIKYWGIEFAQKSFAKLVFCGGNRARLDDLRTLLLESGKADPYRDVTPEVKSFLASYSSTRGLGSYQILLADPEATLADRAKYESLTNFMQALFRDELVPFHVEPDEGGGYRLEVFAHLLPGRSLAALLADRLPDWKTFALTMQVGPLLGGGRPSEVAHGDFRLLGEVVHEHFPEVAVGPYFLPWTATDARFFREAGLRTYGFSPFPLTVTETLQIALPNERMQLPAYVAGVALYREIVARLADRPWEAP